jgi:hypothetical protein
MQAPSVKASDRLPGLFLAASVLLVMLGWTGVLVYLGLRFL